MENNKSLKLCWCFDINLDHVQEEKLRNENSKAIQLFGSKKGFVYCSFMTFYYTNNLGLYLNVTVHSVCTNVINSFIDSVFTRELGNSVSKLHIKKWNFDRSREKKNINNTFWTVRSNYFCIHSVGEKTFSMKRWLGLVMENGKSIYPFFIHPLTFFIFLFVENEQNFLKFRKISFARW